MKLRHTRSALAAFGVALAILVCILPATASTDPPAVEAPETEGRLAARPADAAAITAPPPGSQLSGPAVTFSWSSGTGVAGYFLMVGEWPGGNSLFSARLENERSARVEGLPTDGRMLYARLWSLLDGEWVSRDAQFRAAGSQVPLKAELTSPPPHSVFSGPSVTVEWSAGAGVRRYFLFAGLWPGGNTLFSRDMETARSAVISGLPVNGQTIYLRLWSLIGDDWVPFDAIYTAAGATGQPARAQLIRPAPGSALSGTSAVFEWSAGAGATQYYFFAGLWQGGDTLASIDAGTATSVTVSGLPSGGGTIWIRVWSRIQNEWHYSDAQVQSFDPNPGPPTLAALITPAPGSTLTGPTANFTWSAGRGSHRYFLFVGDWPGDNSFASVDAGQALSVNLANLPVDGRLLFVRLWSHIGGEWLANDFELRAARR